jgi:hypothetical protein
MRRSAAHKQNNNNTNNNREDKQQYQQLRLRLPLRLGVLLSYTTL